MTYQEELPEDQQQQFIADYEDCTHKYKAFADTPFVIPRLQESVIDKIMTGGQIGNLDAKYKSDYYLVGMSHLYRHKELRLIHGMSKLNKIEMIALGRAIQSVYN